MAAIRNGIPVRVAQTNIQPAQTPILVPTVSLTVAAPAPTTVSAVTSISPIINVPVTTPIVQPTPTSANPVLNVTTLTIPTTILSPIVALTGRANPVVVSPVVFTSKPNSIKLLTNKDMVEETLSLDTYTIVNGQPVLDVSSLRSEIISLIDFKPIYNPYLNQSFSNFGTYINDLYQSSLIRDTLRKYLLLNRATATPEFNNTLNAISTRVRNDIARSKNAIKSLDGFIQKIKEINNVLDVKNNLDNVYAFRNPLLGLRDFVTQRMLFSEQSYNIFSDTKILYQLLFDLSGMLEKCSFNLLSSFVDADRSAYVNNPITDKQRNIQDSISIDLTYGDNLRYTPDSIRGKYIIDYVTFNGVVSVLPNASQDRFIFVLNLLSKELRVSKGLGKYNLPEASFFGFGNQGNPFDNVIGGIPSDIFVSPIGSNSLSTLLYLRTSTQNAVVLPFESRQVAGDGETVFVPGTNYFSDGILNGDFSTYNSYRETFSNRITQARNVFDKYLLRQAAFDNTSVGLQSGEMLKSILRYYANSQDLIRQNNNDATNILSFVLMMLGNSNPNIKFEVFKLLLLIAVYDTRKTVTTDFAQTDEFRDLLLGELTQQRIQGFSENLTEENIPQLIDNQIRIITQLVLNNVAPLPPSESNVGTGLSNNKSSIETRNKQALQLGRKVPAPPPNNKNPNNNVAQVQIQQFSNLIYSLRSTDNLFKNILDMCRQLFTACSTNEQTYHLLDGSSATRYHGLTLSGFVLLTFEMFSALVDQFTTRNITYNLVNDQTTKLAAVQYIQVTFSVEALSETSANIRNFLRGTSYSNPIISNYQKKLEQEDYIIDNILRFFERLNNRFTNVATPSSKETTILSEINTNNPNSLSTTRTAKNVLQSIVNKQAIYNPTNNRALDFYLPAGKAVSDRNWEAVKVSLFQPEFIGSSKRKVITVGIPYGFVRSALGARLNKNDVYNGKLQESTSDLINVKIYKLDKNDDGIVFKPQQFKFDLSLFARGFDAYTINEISRSNYYSLKDAFQFYDFDEDLPFDQVTAKTFQQFVAKDPYYRTSIERQRLCLEAVENLYRSFIFDMYLHMVTGLNVSEETFISYFENETTTFTEEMAKIPLGTADLTKVKFMTPEYRELLNAFKNNQDDTKMMLTLCNDITKTVFRQKQYDRTYNIMFDTDKFAVDTNAMSQNKEGNALLQQLTNEDRLYQVNGETYKKPDDLMLDLYFINVEIIQ
jgi:hypothetical protein